MILKQIYPKILEIKHAIFFYEKDISHKLLYVFLHKISSPIFFHKRY